MHTLTVLINPVAGVFDIHSENNNEQRTTMKFLGFALLVLLASTQTIDAQLISTGLLEEYWNIIRDFFQQNWALVQTTLQNLANQANKPPTDSPGSVEVEDAVDSERAKAVEQTENFARAVRQLIDNVNWNITDLALRNAANKEETFRRKRSPQELVNPLSGIAGIFDTFLSSISNLAENLRSTTLQLIATQDGGYKSDREIK